MAAQDGLTFEGTLNALYADNTSNAISEADLRALPTAVKESYLNRIDDAYTGVFPQFTTSTSTTVFAGTPSPAITAYATGQKFQVKIHATSTGASTLNLNALGAKKVFVNPTTQASVGHLLINQVYLMVYDASLDSAVGGFLILGAGAGHTIEDEGTPLTQRTKLNFVGAGVTVTDDSGDDATVVTIPDVSTNTAVAITDAASMDITGPKHTLTTSSATRTFTQSYAGDFTSIVVTLNALSSTFTFPSGALCVSDGLSSGDNTLSLSGASGDKYYISISKYGTDYYVVSKNFGQ